MMSENFDFLRNFNNDLHYLACIIENEIYDSPSAVLTDATTFLEIIVYEIFKKYELSMESLQYFSEKVSVLSEAGFLSLELKKNLLKTYRLRNKMHSYNGDVKNHINLNKNRAVHIHKLLFNVSWLYYNEYCEDSFKVPKPSYIHPSKLKSEIFTESIDSGKCIVCGDKTKSGNEIFCGECKYKIEKCDNLKTLRKHFGFKDGFKRNDLIKIGFEKGYVGSFLQELKNDDLIYTVGKLNFIDKSNTVKYIKEVEEMIGIEKLLSDFKLRNIDLTDILSHEFYLMGQNNQYPFVGFYNLFNRMLYSEFINDLNSDMKIEELLNNTYLTNEELNEWYLNEMKNNSLEFNLFNEKLIDAIFKYKLKDIDFKSKLNIDDLIINTILNDNKGTGELYRQKEEEYLFRLFMKNVSHEKVTKKEALDLTGISENDLDEILRKYPDFQEKYTKSYTISRMKRFIKHYDYYNYKYALKRTGLIQSEIDEWLSKGHKMIKKHADNIFSKFLTQFNELSMQKYIEYRKNKKTRHNAANKIQSNPEDMEKLISQNEKFKNILDKILINHAIEEFKLGKSKEEVITTLDLTPSWLNSSIKKGQNGDEKYLKLYQQYSSNIIPAQIDKFLELLKNKELNNVLKELNMDEDELNSWYEKGKAGDEVFINFYEEFFNYKKERYIKTLMKTQSKQKALKKSYFTQKELNEYEDEFAEEIFERSIEIVKSELEHGKTTKQASKKASVQVKDIYNWIEEALNGNEDYTEFFELYENEYLNPIRMAYKIGVNEGANEKIIIKTMKKSKFLIEEDVKHLKRLDLFPKPEDIVLDMDDDFEIDLKELLF